MIRAAYFYHRIWMIFSSDVKHNSEFIVLYHMRKADNISIRFVVRDENDCELFWFGILKLARSIKVNAFECSFDIPLSDYPKINNLTEKLLSFEESNIHEVQHTANVLGKKLLCVYRIKNPIK